MASAAPEIPVLARDQAFEAIYRRHVKDVYHYALALLRNPADAEDVTQTTFMNAYRAYKRGDEILKPQNWLIKIAHNVARTRYARASRRVKEVPLEDHLEHLAVPEDERPDIEAVLRALGRLPFNQRAALVLRELEGRSYGEIAETLGVSVAAVETLIFRARRSLRMRASMLQSLAAIPLPGSLSQLFGSGGIVAGGGTAAGSGFIVKAAVALLAGAVATGIGSDRTHPAKAAERSASPRVEASGWSLAPTAHLQSTAAASNRTPAVGSRRKHTHARGTRKGGDVTLASVRKRGQLAGAGATAPATAQATPTAAAAASQNEAVAQETVAGVVEPVQAVVDTVEDTATGVVGSLPVEVPPVPVPTVPDPTVPPIKLP
jgi:RNA polymerase sigma-70 factor, ECF subfamily